MDGAPSKKQRWELTQEAFDRFLAALDPDCDRAAAIFEELRDDLIKYFTYREKCRSPQSHAEEHCDETINRLCKKLEEGEKINSFPQYCKRIAYFIVKECIRKELKLDVIDDIDDIDISDDPWKRKAWEDKENLRYKTYQECLQKLSDSKRALILEYYGYKKRNKSEHRQSLADSLGINSNALWSRVRWIKKDLRDCVDKHSKWK